MGVLFGTPRTATISYEVITNGVPDTLLQKALFSISFFGLAGTILMNSTKLLEIVGFFLSPIKISALIFIGVFAWLHPIGNLTTAIAVYDNDAFGTGFINGYQTLDVISALCFGAIITHILHQRGIESEKSIVGYSTKAALISGTGLALIYVCYISMGAHTPEQTASNGMQIMSTYVQTVFGIYGRTLLAAIITLACIVTAIGLTTGTARYFSQTTGVSYTLLVTISLLCSAVIAALGLNSLTALSVPVLCAIYPAVLVVVALGIIRTLVHIPDTIYRTIFFLALAAGIITQF